MTIAVTLESFYQHLKFLIREKMKELPYVEEIYDMETSQLEALLEGINADLMSGGNCEIPE